ncbi:MAG: hypothetical protein U0L49_08815 [Eubacterium sp.]|nr:hypothetical protein [Eubacterium sp.]
MDERKISWNRIYNELIDQIMKMGYPEEFAKEIAKNLGSEKTMSRMIGYLKSARPKSPEEIVDEMLAIMEDRKRWIEKKEAEKANSSYNRMLYYGLGIETEETDNHCKQ